MSSDRHDEIAAKLEFLGGVAQVTLASVLRILKARQEGPLTDEQREKLEQVRNDLHRALVGLDRYEREHPDSDLDLSGLREKVQNTLAALSEEEIETAEDAPIDLDGDD